MSDATVSAPVLLDIADGVATIRLNRPEAMNSLNVEAKELLRDIVEQVAADDAVRCVVLTGTGRAFCVGQDLKEHIQILGSDDSESLFSTVEVHYNPIVTAIATMPKPVIAAVNGVAAGAGASLAFACDLRVLVDSAGFNLAFAGIALSCDTGCSWTLPRLVGQAKAMELLYFPRTLDASASQDLGLANRVVSAEEFDETVARLAGRLATGPTRAFASIRASVGYAATHDLVDSLAFEAEQMARTGASRDHAQAVEAFVAKRPPVFEGY